MDGKMLNSHGVDFLDGPLGLDLDEKDLDEEETRRDMAKILKELKQKHPDKEVSDDVKSKKGFVIICEETINRDLKKKYIQPIRLGNNYYNYKCCFTFLLKLVLCWTYIFLFGVRSQTKPCSGKVRWLRW